MNIPIRYEWSQEEIVVVAEFFDLIAQTQEKGVDASVLKSAYRAFKHVVPSKAEEKQLFKDVDEQLNLSCYKVVKQANEQEGKIQA
ncbi:MULTISPECIES: UPF0223 family protein [Shouchella]|uniref:Uncharacterized protein n=3 Tax=Bacillaceae TaxID=186817 RepID=A0A060LXN8_9BACI|nr:MULTISPECIES: UPF0223 family protein [Bacillaceae]RQW20799.1 hypothetical protein EH196_11990 [Bacillus sp. C1-1]AIC94967.1 hypothetical protein BleG1_2389 [Shouchella lehensis G1]KQL58112.1 hypothetical protein AN965_04870 [Alkalicoccobacillus plakortidis]MBG9784189.1 hypothetical protein [Shouchella lehensis]TES50824.1 hypothetical protein E2L03_02505 [Shouchella lehensis]